MRLGVIGNLKGDLSALANAARLLVDSGRVDRVLYLGKDDSLDRVVGSWAREIVGANPSQEALFARATRACVNAKPDEITDFVESERARRRLRVFASVPLPPGRTIEILDGRIVVFVYDKGALDEEDIGGASVLVFGRAETRVVHRVGSRAFVSPGPVRPPESAGLAILDDDSPGCIVVEFLSSDGSVEHVERLEPKAGAGKMKVQGGGP
jgi:hypothetical protein